MRPNVIIPKEPEIPYVEELLLNNKTKLLHILHSEQI